MIIKISTKKFLLTTRQIVLYLVDAHNFMYQVFDGSKHYQKNIDDYFSWRDFDKQRFRNILNRLKKEKIIEVFHKDDQEIIKLTKFGKSKVPHYLSEEMPEIRQTDWDGKWRMVLFDIPNTKTKTRDAFRRKLQEFGFLQLQKSIFVFPYECAQEIRYLRDLYDIDLYVKYLVADIIESEIDLVSEFTRTGILKDRANKLKIKRLAAKGKS